MRDHAWQKSNDDYLGLAIAWIRLKLMRHSDREPQPVVSEPAPPSASIPPRRRWWSRSSDTESESAESHREPLLLPPGGTVTEQQVAEARKKMENAAAMQPPPALIDLASKLGLSEFERDVLLLCAAVELDPRVAQLCIHAPNNSGLPCPTFALALVLFEDAAWEAVSPYGPLRHLRLLEVYQPPMSGFTSSALRADERIANYIKGLDYLDERLALLMTPMTAQPGADLALPHSHQRASAVVHAALTDMNGSPIVQLVGPDRASKELVALDAARAANIILYRFPAELLQAQASELESLARLLERDMALSPFGLYLDAHDFSAEPAEAQSALVTRFLARTKGPVLLDTQEVRGGAGRATAPVDIQKPTRAEQRDAWTAELGEGGGDIPARLAGQFNLSRPAIHTIVREVLAQAADSGAISDRLWAACLAAARPRVESLAERIEPKATWNDIVLTATERILLEQIAGQVDQRSRVYQDWGFADARSRGLGISALFTGESGVGKTMAAEVLANHLKLNLYRIDLAGVVSKYIGQTEKNLKRLFDAVEDGGAILFFDEADALFGKRSEVKDSHDRYANIEINYLLQRMESYGGLAILASNMKSALDPAFLRRIRFVVEFHPHTAAERKEIWKRVFPAKTLTEGLDYDRLARLTLNGGGINSVAMNAAFLAAKANTPVTMPMVLSAARTEFIKLKRPINEDDFRWGGPVGALA